MILLLPFICLYICVEGVQCAQQPEDGGFVAVQLAGQLGNQLFQLAAGYAYALDTGAQFIVPDLANKDMYNIPHNTERLYRWIPELRVQNLPTDGQTQWRQPSFKYTPIPRLRNVLLIGYFQSEKYFLHRRDEIQRVFSPPPHIQQSVLSNHSVLTSGRYTVGVQVRDYRAEQPKGRYHPTLTSSFYTAAMKRFPEDAVFIVTSNNEQYAREVTRAFSHRTVYLTSKGKEDHIDHFYALYFCRAFIIANSSFGWWAAWLSMSASKTVIAPRQWFAAPYRNNDMTVDLYPQNATII